MLSRSGDDTILVSGRQPSESCTFDLVVVGGGLAENFFQVARAPLFWDAFRNTWLYTAGMLLVQVPLALVLAVVLNRPTLRGRVVYRTLFFLPVVATTAVIGVVMVILLSPAGGPVNNLLLEAGLVRRPVNFLGAASLALPTVVAIGIWKGLGTVMIYWLAGLQSVPGELYDAARIDGANSAQVLRFVTLPLLRPVALTIVALTLVWSLNVFELVQVMTSGGPGNATDVIATYIYRVAFTVEDTVPRMGYASAAGVFFGLTNLVIVLVQFLSVRAAGRSRRSV
jgi:multiple sugar transport system permease protein